MNVSNERVRLLSNSSYAERNFSISRAMRLNAERRKSKKKAIVKSDFTVSEEVIDVLSNHAFERAYHRIGRTRNFPLTKAKISGFSESFTITS